MIDSPSHYELRHTINLQGGAFKLDILCPQSPIIDINNREHPTELRQIKILEIEIKSKSLANDFKSRSCPNVSKTNQIYPLRQIKYLYSDLTVICKSQ